MGSLFCLTGVLKYSVGNSVMSGSGIFEPLQCKCYLRNSDYIYTSVANTS
jgi:hypothetical protein